MKTSLADGDAATAWRAMWTLRQIPEQAVPLMVECLRSKMPSPDFRKVVQEVKRLISDLDNDDFETRKKAYEKLTRMLKEKVDSRPIVESTIRQMLAEKTSVEVNNALARLLRENSGGSGSPELIRMVRAVEVLERINNCPARDFLAKLLEAPPRPEIRREAQAALKRLALFVPPQCSENH